MKNIDFASRLFNTGMTAEEFVDTTSTMTAPDVFQVAGELAEFLYENEAANLSTLPAQRLDVLSIRSNSQIVTFGAVGLISYVGYEYGFPSEVSAMPGEFVLAQMLETRTLPESMVRSDTGERLFKLAEQVSYPVHDPLEGILSMSDYWKELAIATSKQFKPWASFSEH